MMCIAEMTCKKDKQIGREKKRRNKRGNTDLARLQQWQILVESGIHCLGLNIFFQKKKKLTKKFTQQFLAQSEFQLAATENNTSEI